MNLFPSRFFLFSLGFIWAVESLSAFPIYVANYASGTVSQLDTSNPSAGSSLFLSGLANPVGVAVDPSGNVYVSMFGNNGTIEKYDASGTLLTSAQNIGGQPYSLRFDINGTLFMCDGSGARIRRFDDNLNELTDFAAISGFPTSIKFNASGNALVANASTGDNILAYDTNGSLLNAFGGLPDVNEPHDVEQDLDGNYYVANRGSQTIEKFDSSGAYLENFAAGFDPYSIIISGNLLFVANHDVSGTVEIFDLTTKANQGSVAVGSRPTYMAVNPLNVIPEPSTFSLLAISLGGWALLRRRRSA